MKILLSYEYENVFNVLYFIEKSAVEMGHEVFHDDYTGEVDLIICTCPKKGYRRGNAKTFYWEIDAVRKRANEPMGDYDLLFLDNRNVEQYHNYIFLPVGADPDIHKNTGIEPSFDVVNVGAFGKSDIYFGYGERERIFEVLQANGYTTYKTAGVFGADYARELSKGRFILNRAGLTDLNTRYFEAMSIGCMLFYELGTYYDIGIPDYHYVSFKDDDEMLRKVKYYLDHPDERLKIVQQARELILARHTYKHRLLEMLSYL